MTPKLFLARFGLKILGGLAGIGVIVLAFLLVVEKAETRHLSKVNERLTGDLAQARRDLAQAQTNVLTVRAALDRQNAALENLRIEGRRRIAAAEARLAEAQRNRADAERRAARIASSPPQGATDCEQLLDIDRRVTENLR